MNGWPRINIPAVLRRPLMWAALCSLLLHLPILVWFAPWPHLPADKSDPDNVARDSPMLSLALIADAAPTTPAPPAALPVLPVPQRTEEVVSAAPASAVTTVPLPAASAANITDSLVNGDVPVRVDPMPAGPSGGTQPLNPERLVVAPVSPVVVPQPADSLAESGAVLPAVVVMDEQERNRIDGALQSLLATLNSTGSMSEMAVPATSLGLLPNDAITLAALPLQGVDHLQEIDVVITRTADNRIYQMRARLQERALSYYAKFINRWDNNVMLSNDRVDGRFHANSTVNFEVSADAQPQFNGEVTLARRQSMAWRLRQSSMFAGGLRTGTGRIALPAETLPAHWLSAGATVVTLATDARLHFQGNHGVVWSDSKTTTTGHIPVPDGGLIIVGAQGTSFELSGTIAGKVMVFSPRQLLIIDDLVYTSRDADASDALALVSEGSIEVAPASVTGTGDLEIHGALFARQRFSVRRFRDSHQGMLYVYGALVAGSVSATEPRFYTHIEHDPRFEYQRAPAFPSAGVFDLRMWEQHWTDVTDSDAVLASVVDSAATQVP